MYGAILLSTASMRRSGKQGAHFCDGRIHDRLGIRRRRNKMIGRQVILTNRAFTLEELYDFMNAHWDVNEGGSFVKGRPTKASVEE